MKFQYPSISKISFACTNSFPVSNQISKVKEGQSHFLSKPGRLNTTVQKTFLLLFVMFVFWGSSNVLAQISGYIPDKKLFDYSDFEPLTPEQFVNQNFDFLNREYQLDSSILKTGLRIEVVPSSNPSRYHPSVKTHQIYGPLIRSVVLLWAKQNNFQVYLDHGYNLERNDAGISIGINYEQSIWGPPYNKTLEKDFKDNNPYIYTNALYDYSVLNSRYGTLHGILSFENEKLIIADSSNIEDYNKVIRQKIQSGETASHEWTVATIKKFADAYLGGLTLNSSKYGNFAASITRYNKQPGISGELSLAKGLVNSILLECDKQINIARGIYLKKIGKEPENESSDEVMVVEVSAPGYISDTRGLKKANLDASEIMISGHVLDKDGKPVKGATVKLRGVDAKTSTDDEGQFNLFAKMEGKEPYSESMDIKLQKIEFQISNDELGNYEKDKNFGIVSDGFTTLKLKIKVKGIRPETVVVTPPRIGSFVKHSFLKIPMVLDKNGEGDMEYVPPAYITYTMLAKKLKVDQNEHNMYGISGSLWAVDVPIKISFEDNNGNPGSYTFNIQVCRPPVMLIHGFTGDESTWEHLSVQLRRDKFDAIIREYYRGPIEESTIQRQSEKLGFYIQKLREAYLKNGIIQNRVDIVAHSMGGLISRYYISNMSKYGKKSGIVIPYDVRLSHDELAKQRFQKPVILNDVRKLIMVGTPNHGSSFLDERIGALSALIADYHQIANELLPNNSKFMTDLNAGESEGRHLSPNVQYALIYGRRRRSSAFVPDIIQHPLQTSERKLIDDDGVVTVESAKLNGVVSYEFPEDRPPENGYIHSPAVGNFFKGDTPITTDPHVFNKIETLLLEDIPRVPLSNSVSKIIYASGQVFMRYYAIQNWIPLKAVKSAEPKVLKYNYCRIKTEEGESTLGFFLNGHHWGSLSIQPHSIVYYEFASPEYVRVYLQQGKARFLSRKQGGNSFEVVMGDKNVERWYEFNPKARVKDLNTDFIVEKDSTVAVHSISGKVMLGVISNKNKKPVTEQITAKKGYLLTKQGEIKESPLPESGWWSNIDTTYLQDALPDSLKSLLTDENVHLTFENKFLPVSGFTTLKVHVDSIASDTAFRSYRVSIVLNKDSLYPFINITNPSEITDSMGNYQTEITLREPTLEDCQSLKTLPLKASFSLQISKPDTNIMLYEKDTVLPLGMTLLFTQVTGSDGHARKQPFPPELRNTTYQIANEADSMGNIYILFNTTLFEKNRARMKAYSERTSKKMDEQALHFSLQWSDSCSFPLLYQIPDSITNQLEAAQRIRLGKNGAFDLLTSEEQQQRLQETVKDFIQKMKLSDESRAKLLSKLDSIKWQYDADVKSPVYNRSNIIEMPLSARAFWNHAMQDTTGLSYANLLRVMGNFISANLYSARRNNFTFLEKALQKPGPTPVKQKNDKGESFFDKQDYISFAQTDANLFAVMMTRMLESDTSSLVTGSLLFNPKYVHWISDSAMQTKFLLEYYGNYCSTSPALVYSDFLLNRYLFSYYTNTSFIAMTMNEWLAIKKASLNESYLIKVNDPYPLAKQYHIPDEQLQAVLIPVSDFGNCSVMINGETITDFDQIPAILLWKDSQVQIVGGKFKLQFPTLGASYFLEMMPGSEFKTEKGIGLWLLNGHFHFSAPISFQTKMASINPKSKDFSISIDARQTHVVVNEGQVNMRNAKNDRVATEGQYLDMNKNGNIHKPKEIKNFVKYVPRPRMKLPFVLDRLEYFQ